ncbi:MAG: hypothetical protein LBJ25_06165 [Candidatus Margulisbacteria bacterium]|jgi:hypothetical protein|nr:hypothetical protein [Candidatus Margulisiibacteriota bacterium]
MEVNMFSLNSIFTRVFPTFKTGDEWIDLKNNTGRLDGIRQSHEILKNTNDIGSRETAIDDDDIVVFLRKNIVNIPDDKVAELVDVLLEYIQQNPVGEPYYEGESSFMAEKSLAIIIAYNPQYLSSIEELLANNSFLIRWAAVTTVLLSQDDSRLAGALLNKETLQGESITKKIFSLYENEQNKKITDESPDIKVTYYQIGELYAEYLNNLKQLVDYLS